MTSGGWLMTSFAGAWNSSPLVGLIYRPALCLPKKSASYIVLLNPHAVFAIRSARISSGARHVLHDDRGIGGNIFPMLLE